VGLGSKMSGPLVEPPEADRKKEEKLTNSDVTPMFYLNDSDQSTQNR
jgi:hypothetical protein